MGVVTMRRSIGAVVVLVVCTGLLLAALPLLASTRIVRDRIALELGELTGYRVTLDAAPRIDVWPVFKATLDDVAFSSWTPDATSPVLDADSMDVALSPLAALRGDVVISSIAMKRPVLRLPAGAGQELATGSRGRLAHALALARAVVAENPSAPDASAFPDAALGNVEFSDGRIIIGDDDQGNLVTALNGRITWPALNRAGALAASGIWHGENVSLDISSPQPLLLLGGASSPLKATLKSQLLDFSFDGTASLTGDGFVDGQTTLRTPSLRRMLDWVKTPVSMSAALGDSAVSGRMQGNFRRLRLDEATVSLGGSSGRGVLDVVLSESTPAVSGTLAFETLNLGNLVSIFAPPAGGDGNIYDSIASGLADQVALDLRLSARAAEFRGITLSDVAASAQVKGPLAAFDISDATVFGGEFQAGLRIDGDGEARAVEMRAMANDIDALAAAKALGAERVVPQGKAGFSAILKGAGRDWNTAMGNAEGSVTATLGSGSLAGFDLARFRERSSQGGFFALSEVNGGNLPLRGLDFKAKVTGGVARIEKAEALLEGQVVSLTGIVPYFSRALALSGYFAALSTDGSRGEPQDPFFIGGAWDAPFVSRANPWSVYE